MNNLAIIPARGGSKRIPRKNIKNFLEKPIIAYSIEAALESKLFDEVMVSTDDEEIAAISIQYGAKVPFLRSRENADDFAGLNSVFLEVLNYYKTEGRAFSHFCGILSTAPLLRKEQLIGSHALLDEHVGAVIPVVEYDFPIERFLTVNDAGLLNIGNPDQYRKRSQDLPDNVHDAGQFYWARFEGFLQEKGFYKLNAKPYRLDKNLFQDIDTPEDWKRVELIARLIFEGDQRSPQ